MATINDVSRLAKVSIATVSRVLTGSRGVREKSRTAVLEAAQELNYQPNAAARDLARQKSDNIAVLLFADDQVRFSVMVPYLEKQLSDLGKNMMLHFFRTELEQFKLLKSLTESSCEAVILFGGYDTDIKSPKLLKVDSSDCGSHSINYNYNFAAETATRFLANKGHRNIGMVIDSREDQGSKEMINGFKVAQKELARPLNSQLIFNAIPNLDQAVISLINNKSQCSAIIVKRDVHAAEAMNLFREFGIRVPDDMSVISLEGSQLAQYLYPKLTVITYPYESIIDITLSRLEAIIGETGISADACPVAGRLVSGDSVAVFNKPA
ncbi:LacI family transcriptional regulator [Photobacterium sagamiensis]|uniref:LacI family DNA-binding transcriptional regulator n=1 Tax=Photobacterium sagamiensis TaxID=2910241 RepID=UPI003D109804